MKNMLKRVGTTTLPEDGHAYAWGGGGLLTIVLIVVLLLIIF